MNDGIEQLLQIDAFGQAVGSNQQPLLGCGHVVYPRAPVLGGQRAGHRLYAQFREGFAETGGNVIGGRDEAAEDDRVGAVGNQRLQDFDCRVELRIRGPGQALGSRHEAAERPRYLQPRRRLDVERVHLIGVVIEDLLFEPVGIRREAVAQRAKRGGRRRADAAHQRQCPPEGEPSPTLVRSGAFNDAKAVVEHRVVEGAVLRTQIISTLGRFMAGEGPLRLAG